VTPPALLAWDKWLLTWLDKHAAGWDQAKTWDEIEQAMRDAKCTLGRSQIRTCKERLVENGYLLVPSPFGIYRPQSLADYQRGRAVWVAKVADMNRKTAVMDRVAGDRWNPTPVAAGTPKTPEERHATPAAGADGHKEDHMADGEVAPTIYYRYPEAEPAPCACGRTRHTCFEKQDGTKMCGACMQADAVPEGSKKKVINGQPGETA
jgi:hypothetical protein